MADGISNWTGFYIGGTLGAVWSDVDARTAVASSGDYFITTDPAQIAAIGIEDRNATDFSGGVQAGYNWQMGQLLLGVETDFSLQPVSTSASGSAEYLSVPGTGFTVTSAADADWLLTLRPRIGYANGPWLVYGTGGLAVTDADVDFRFTDTYGLHARESASASARFGWVVGAGLETRLAGNWTLKGEYLFANFGSADADGVVTHTTATPPAVLVHDVELTEQIIRFGINYQLDFAAP